MYGGVGCGMQLCSHPCLIYIMKNGGPAVTKQGDKKTEKMGSIARMEI